MDFLWQGKKVLCSTILSLPCPAAWRGVFAQQNIGEVARSDGGVKEKDKKVWLFRLYRKIQSPHKSYMIYEGFL